MSAPNESSHRRSGSWLEGTLDVISGAVRRPTTPLRGTIDGSHKRSMSAPNSPVIQRLPSQDSLDRSVHNDSTGKSTAQVIRDLRAANARLTAQTASIEANYMNQLNELTRELGDKESLEDKCRDLERQVQERDEAVLKLKDEAAFLRHSVSELKAPRGGSEMGLKRQIADLNEELAQQPPSSGSDRLQRTQEALVRTESALAKLQKSQKESAVERERLAAKFKADWEKRESEWQGKLSEMATRGDVGSQIRERDIMIAELRQQVLDYSQQLTDMTVQLADLKTASEHQELYRRDEADDLRVLNDAQDEEITSLRQQLEDAMREIELRDQELEERAANAEDDEVLEESTRVVAELQKQLESSRKSLQLLSNELKSTKEDHEEHVSTLEDRLAVLESERDELFACQSEDSEYQQEVARLSSSLKEKESGFAKLEKQLMEKESGFAKLEKQLKEAKDALATANKQRDDLEASHKITLAQLEKEREKAEASSKTDRSLALGTATGEPTSDSARITELNAEVATLKRKLETAPSGEQSGGSLEEDLRKELSRARGSEQKLANDLQTLADQTSVNLEELRAKLADRDTTISALVKSSALLEGQIAMSQTEVETLRRELSRAQGKDDGDELLPALGSIDDTAQLRRKLNESREAEERHAKEAFRLKRQLRSLKQDLAKMRNHIGSEMIESARAADEEASASGSVISSSHHLQERDEAIARLVKQSMAQERALTDLREKNNWLTDELDRAKNGGMGGSSAIDEIAQLRQETEVYAGQVIELNEDIEALKGEVASRDTRIQSLNKHIDELKLKVASASSPPPPPPPPVNASRVVDLEAEIDEMKEANEVQRDELRLLRRKVRDLEVREDEVSEIRNALKAAEAEIERLLSQLEGATEEKDRIEKQLADIRTENPSSEEKKSEDDSEAKELAEKVAALEERIKELESLVSEKEATIDELQKSVAAQQSQVDEMEVEGLREEIERLKSSLDHQTSAVDSARGTIRELEKLVAQNASNEASAFEEDKEELLTEIERLTEELESTKKTLDEFESERGLVDDFKKKLEEADEAREASEKSIVDTYERKLSLLTLDKDVTIDKLRKDLSNEKEASSLVQKELAEKAEQYDAQLEELREELSAELQQRETRIFALEQTLSAQDQLVGNMKTEMDQLQGSMVHSTVGRREEIDELQQELSGLNETIAKQEREIKALQMSLDEKKLAHEAEVEKLKETISHLESELTPDAHRTAADLQMELRMQEVKDRLDKLRFTNTNLQEENSNLRKRMNQLQSEDAYVQLKEQTSRVKEVELELSVAKKEAARLREVEKKYLAHKEKVAAKAAAQTPVVATSSSKEDKNKARSATPRRRGFLGLRSKTDQ